MTKNIWSGIRTTKSAKSQVFAGGRDAKLRDSKQGRARQQQDPVFTYDKARWGSQSQNMLNKIKQEISGQGTK